MESNNKKEDNNQRSFEEVLNSILEEMGNVLNIKSADIPNIDLYMDQVLSFLDEKLNYTRRSTDDGEEKIFTKTMLQLKRNKLFTRRRRIRFNSPNL